MGYDETTRNRDKQQDAIEWITEATIPIEIEAANRDCEKLRQDLNKSSGKDISVRIKWDNFVGLPDFINLGHDTVVTTMRNVYQVRNKAQMDLFQYVPL